MEKIAITGIGIVSPSGIDKRKFWLSIFILLIFSSTVHADVHTADTFISQPQIKNPVFSVNQAIDLAQRYVEKNKIDVSKSFIAHVEYLNSSKENEKSYWRVDYRYLPSELTRGGELLIFIYEDGSIEFGVGE